MTRVFEFGGFRLDAAARTLTCGGEPIELTDKPFDLLHVLARAAGSIVSKEHLVEQVWNGAAIGDSNISQHLLFLRRALRDEDRPHRIVQTIHGNGYRLLPQVRVRVESDPHEPRKAFRAAAALQYVRAARHFAKMGSLPSILSSNELCYFALEHDSACADALAQLAINAIVQAACGYTLGETALASCAQYAAQALRLDPSCARAQLALGFARLLRGQVPERSVAATPESHVFRMLAELAQRRSAREAAAHAIMRHPSSVLVATYAAFTAYHAGAVDDAAATLHRLLASRPDAAFARVLLGRTLLARSQFSLARAQFETMLFPRAPYAGRFEKFRGDAIAGLAYAAAREGDRHGAAALRDDLLRSHPHDHYAHALTALALGDTGGGESALAQGAAAHDPRMLFANLDPLLRRA
jgi:DNA-binding winged helix-turn-helix (wHTH) protein/predicted negative regulator of RcsB-dependent stress response